MTVEVDLFAQTFELEQIDPLHTEDDQVWRRWAVVAKGLQIALCQSMTSGQWNAYINFEESEPTVRRFNFWGKESADAEGAITSLRESIVSAAGLLSLVLRGSVEQ